MPRKDKFKEVFAAQFKTAPDERELEELSQPQDQISIDQKPIDQKMIDQNMVYQKFVEQNMMDQKLLDQKLIQLMNLILEKDISLSSKLALLVFLIKSGSTKFKMSINSVSNALKVSRTTAMKILKELKEIGVVAYQGKEGTFVDVERLS